MNIKLQKIQPHQIGLFRQEMRKAFEQGVCDRFGDVTAAPVPPEDEVNKASADNASDVFIILKDDIPAGGTIIKQLSGKKYSLELLFIFKDFLNQRIGSAAWNAIEQHYADAEIWETYTPYFERRNIHFYLNKCNFKIVEFAPDELAGEFKDRNSAGFFRFEKIIRR